jgi:hypothetical protein
VPTAAKKLGGKTKKKTGAANPKAATSKNEGTKEPSLDGHPNNGSTTKTGTTGKPKTAKPDVGKPQAGKLETGKLETERKKANTDRTSDPATNATAKVTPAADLYAAAIRLPQAVAGFPKDLRSAAELVLPSDKVQIPPARIWAPVLTYLTLRALPSPDYALQVFDELHLRNALAETFSAVGISGEDAWRAAARIRVLLLAATKPSIEAVLASPDFWYDADVHWLSGISGGSPDTDLFHPDSLASFLAWLSLPQLLEDPTSSPDATYRLARQAKFNVANFLKALESPTNLPDEAAEEAALATSGGPKP